MIHYKFQYPGDPVSVCREMTKAEFLALNPERSIRITDSDGQVIYDQDVGDRVECDGCSRNIVDLDTHVFLLPDINYLYCRQCAEQSVLPYVLNGRGSA